MREFVREIFAGVYAPFTGRFLASFALLPVVFAISASASPTVGLGNIVDESALYDTAEAIEVDKSEIKEPDAGNAPVVEVQNKPVVPVGIADNSAPVKYDLTIGGKIATNVVNVGMDGNTMAVPGYGAGYYSDYGAHLLVGHNPGSFSGLLGVAAGDIVEFRGVNYVVTGSRIYNHDPGVGNYDSNNQMNENGQMMYDSLYSGGANGLNFMTCFGSYLPNYGTYDQRLVVFATKM